MDAILVTVLVMLGAGALMVVMLPVGLIAVGLVMGRVSGRRYRRRRSAG